MGGGIFDQPFPLAQIAMQGGNLGGGAEAAAQKTIRVQLS
jgi:hypothetical protein